MMGGMRLRPVVLLAGVILLAACSGGGSDSASTTTAPPPSTVPTPANVPTLTAPGRENIAFYYQRISRTTDLAKLGSVSLVVTGKTAGRTAAVAIKKTGARAYRGVQAYWFADGDSYDGLEVTKRMDWAFCLSGDTPLVARTDAQGVKWYFLDSNERGVRDAFAQRMEILKQQGWNGIFFDRGFAAMTGRDDVANPAWDKVSTCTQDPVAANATLSDAYVGMAGEVRKAGLDLIVNYGTSPFDATVPMRPDPRDPKCQDKQKGCKTLEDVWPEVDGVLDEAVAHPKDVNWANDYRSNSLNEQMSHQGKNVVGLLTQGTMGGHHSRDVAYYEWARVKLFTIPLAVNTGDDGCGNPAPGALCNRQALYPELANIAFGTPVVSAPQSSQCTSGSKVHCIWVRRYANGMSLVNVSPTTKQTGSLPLGVKGCRYVKDVSTGQPLAGPKACITSVSLSAKAWSGHPLVYSESPW
jgi:hypothetical protein